MKPEVEIHDDEPVLEATWLKEYTRQSEYRRFSLGEWVREEREPRGHRHAFVPKGAGKTSVLEALSDMLVVDDVRHALIETEALR